MASSDAAAADVGVGRATVQTDAGWRVFVLEDQGKSYGGDISGTIPTETKVFVHETADKTLNAVAIVRASSGGVGRGSMLYTPNCKGNASMLAVGNSGFNQRYAECWKVARKQVSQAILKAMAPRVLPGLSNLQFPETLVPIVSSYANANGSFMDVTLFLSPAFVGRDGQFSETLPEGVEIRFALAGQDLAQAVRESVNSFSGKFSFPAMAFSK